ncbi:MAG: TldD/PmbA family protein [Planctomycetes bacterium]|nr:TldD/PmbA family protein [Planctomycetota bacterium]MBI3835437.1 TldD/PmbA family protein [Planctomycetota bacterium]
MSSSSDWNRRDFLYAAVGGAAGMYLGGCSRSLSRPYSDLRPTAMGPAPKNRWPELAQIAMDRVRRGGCDYGDIRLIETRTQNVSARDRRIANVDERLDSGYGIRVLYRGAWGFAASADFTNDEVRRTADLAVEIARASHTLMKEPVRLADEPVHNDSVKTAFQIDPFTISLNEKCNLLTEVSEALHRQNGIIRSNGNLWCQRDVKHFASTEGSAIDFNLLAVGAGFGATAKGDDGDFQSRSYDVTNKRIGWEHIVAGNLLANAPRVAEQAVEKVKARQPEPKKYDLVLDSGHLALTIHESCGHPTELDRALGYEANYAGTSFLTPEKLNNFRYASKHVTIVADNTRPTALASTGYDDDGVAGQRWPIIEEGILRGYSTNREVARAIGEKRSRGSCRADSWAAIPIVRISNVGLEPGSETLDSLFNGVDDGIYIEGRGSFSIDQRRYNLQFGGDVFWEIKNGKRGAMLKNVIYNGITPEFWGSCDGVGNKETWREHGFTNCGKGQPGQSGWMTHAASPARFRQINVINPKA